MIDQTILRSKFMGSSPVPGPVTLLLAGLVMFAILVASSPTNITANSPSITGTQAPADDPKAITETAKPTAPTDGVLPIDRAWEYSHYRVRVWICTDGSIAADSLLKGLPDAVRRLSELCDPSGWELLPVNAPIQWRWKCLNGISAPAKMLKDIGRSAELQFDDKLMIVNLAQGESGAICQVRELDLTTNQWGALIENPVEQTGQAAEVVFSMIRTAFMPLALIDRVTEDNEVYMRVKGANLCHNVQFDAELQKWNVHLNSGSPVWVQASDFLIPVLRKTDRDNKLLSQDPVELTYIKVDPAGPPKEAEKPAPVGNTGDGAAATATDSAATSAVAAATSAVAAATIEEPENRGVVADETSTNAVVRDDAGNESNNSPVVLGENLAELFGRVQSSFRAPLVARKSKRLEKLALVIRPPSGTTLLKLTSADATNQPMEGIEIWSRPLDAEKDDRSEFLGKTDWRGVLDIPPSPEGLRMLYLKRGARALRKLPVMPGLYRTVETTIVNDEARLFSEGIIAGLGNEILDVVAQREIFEKLIGEYLNAESPEKINVGKASDELKKYTELPRFQQLRARLSDEKSRLQAQSSDKREEDFINNMFESLEKVLTKFLGESRESELRQRIQSLQPPEAVPGNPG